MKPLNFEHVLMILRRIKGKTPLFFSGDIPAASPNENVVSTLQGVFKSKLNYEIPNSAISTAYRVGKKVPTQSPDKRNIVFKLSSKDIKNDIRGACRSVKPSNLYVNESLIPSRSKILYALRSAKRQFPDKVAACGSVEGKVYCWLKPPSPPGNNSRVFINTMAKLEEICSSFIGTTSSSLLNVN